MLKTFSTTNDPVSVVADVEDERRRQVDEVSEPRGIEPTGRVREAEVAHRARHIGPPRVDGAVGALEVGCQLAEEVERERGGRQEVGPQSLVIDALVSLDEPRPGARRVQGARRHEVRTRVPAPLERKAAPDWSRGAAGWGREGLRADRVPASLAPARLVQAKLSTKRGEVWLPRDVVVRLPALSGLELLLCRPVRHGSRGTRGRVP